MANKIRVAMLVVLQVVLLLSVLANSQTSVPAIPDPTVYVNDHSSATLVVTDVTTGQTFEHLKPGERCAVSISDPPGNHVIVFEYYTEAQTTKQISNITINWGPVTVNIADDPSGHGFVINMVG